MAKAKPLPEPETKELGEIPLGEKVYVDGPGGLAVLPDGMVTTVRLEYLIRHAGPHRIITGTDLPDLVFTGVDTDLEIGPAEEPEKPEPAPAA